MPTPSLIDKLRILLPHWQTHNRGHAAEFATWAATARTEGAEPLAALLERAAAHLTETDAVLRQAAIEIGAPADAHAHPHDHPHPHHAAHEGES